ncbi:hypothetical protein [Jeotgalibacillus proteolyticus]|uniref:Uncharacterized protein n=1 Tax=Jeotgalibacillus proteolyticus TaxID=2082395 RepID=A0A2S5G9S3_9BACL|nr:hypothetical protein [Jeotgalibacillus proteolyticus]PPA69671.1 hypothetical protein C4B60_14100 [Jeotgalibacillus proteolyticus]
MSNMTSSDMGRSKPKPKSTRAGTKHARTHFRKQESSEQPWVKPLAIKVKQYDNLSQSVEIARLREGADEALRKSYNR